MGAEPSGVWRDERITDERITIVDPAGRLVGSRGRLATRRLGAGSRAPIGILHNSKHNADLLMRELATELGSKYSTADVIFTAKPLPGVSVTDEQVGMLSHCSVVLTGSGD